MMATKRSMYSREWKLEAVRLEGTPRGNVKAVHTGARYNRLGVAAPHNEG